MIKYKTKYNRFWAKVRHCEHKNISPSYNELISCPTPYCYGSEYRCLDCKVYISECLCGYNTGMSGWPLSRLFPLKWRI
jgi:hypothetical protein